jgi:hypothetical protein
MERTHGRVKYYHGPIDVAAHGKLRGKTINAHAWFFTHDFQKPALPGFKSAIVSRCTQITKSSEEGYNEH